MTYREKLRSRAKVYAPEIAAILAVPKDWIKSWDRSGIIQQTNKAAHVKIYSAEDVAKSVMAIPDCDPTLFERACEWLSQIRKSKSAQRSQ